MLSQLYINCAITAILIKYICIPATIQKRLKKEKKAKRKLQEALEFESKRREQVEQALKQATSGDGLRMLNGNVLVGLSQLTYSDV